MLDAVKQYGQNVNLSVGESSDFYNGSSFVNVVTVVNCSHREFQVGLVDNNGTSASPVLNTMSAEDKKIWVKTEGLIAIAPGVVCTNGKLIII